VQSAQTISNVYAWRSNQNLSSTPNFNNCVLRPITVPNSIISTAALYSTITVVRQTGPGNFSWVENNKKDHTDPRTLAIQLTNETGFAYIQSDNPADQVVSIGDWISGVPGNKNASAIRKSLDWLITNEVPIILPVWGTYIAQGFN
jgi:hypothetical protein